MLMKPNRQKKELHMPSKTTTPTEEMVKNIGLPAKTGTIKLEKGKYVLAVGRSAKEIPSAMVNSADLGKLVNTEVTALLAGSNIVAILPKKPGRPPWICYIPVPDIFKRINSELQATLVDKYVSLGALTKVQGEQVKQQVLQIG